MTPFHVPGREDVTAANQAIFDQLKSRLGRVPNLYATLAHSEHALGSYLAFQNAPSSITGKAREVVNLVVSEVNACAYCLAAHTLIGGMVGFTPEQILEIRSGRASFDGRLDALAQLVRDIAQRRGHADPELVDRFLAAGWTKEHLVDAIVAIGDKVVTNYLHATTRVPVDFPAAPRPSESAKGGRPSPGADSRPLLQMSEGGPAVTAPLRSPDDIVFSASVRSMQERRGSRRAYASAAWPSEISDELAEFIAAQTSVFLATASADGQPYIQHRGGPAGFLKVIDAHTIAFADFRGNRQFITAGNLAENDRIQMFLIDYTHQRRVKIWWRARFVEDDPALVARLKPADESIRADQAIVVTVEACDVNCPKHIPQRFEAEPVREAIAVRDARILELEAEVAALRARRAPA